MNSKQEGHCTLHVTQTCKKCMSLKRKWCFYGEVLFLKKQFVKAQLSAFSFSVSDRHILDEFSRYIHT